MVATLNQYVRNKIEPGTLEQRVLTTMLMRYGQVEFNKGGVNFSWPVRTRRVGNFREHDVFQDVTASPEKSEVLVAESFGRYIQTEFIDDEEMLVNRGDMEKIYDMYREKIDAMAEDGKDELHMELHVGDKTGRRIAGLNTILPAAALGTVHGQAQTGNAWWTHVRLDAAGGPSTNQVTDLIERVRTGLISADRGDAAGRPNFGITTPTIYGRFVEKHLANERYVAKAAAIGPDLEAIVVQGCPIFYDKHAEANVTRLLNGKKLALRFRTSGIFITDIQRPSNKRGDQIVKECFPQLINKNPRYHTVIYNYS
ncbi:MAG: phage major capsid protein [Flavobacteriales bacterium]|nr:phage major capsid protein [Flavobacteriales bacterium]